MSQMETVLAILVPLQAAFGAVSVVALMVNASRVADVSRHLNEIRNSLDLLSAAAERGLANSCAFAAGIDVEMCGFTVQESETFVPDLDSSAYGLQPLDGNADGLSVRCRRLISRLLGRPAQPVEHVERGAEAPVGLRHPLGDSHEEHLQGQDAPAQVGFKGCEPLVVRRLHDGFLSFQPVFHAMPPAPPASGGAA